MNGTWTSEEIDQAKAELIAAGWIAKTPTLWKSPSGMLYLGPAGAWRVMKRALNDARHSGPPAVCRVCGGSGFVAEKRCIDDGYGEVDSCPACDKRDAEMRRTAVIAWARERRDNTYRLAALKTGADRDGWLEDAAYWEDIVSLLDSIGAVPPQEGRE